jgi:hypothetical protein
MLNRCGSYETADTPHHVGQSGGRNATDMMHYVSTRQQSVPRPNHTVLFRSQYNTVRKKGHDTGHHATDTSMQQSTQPHSSSTHLACRHLHVRHPLCRHLLCPRRCGPSGSWPRQSGSFGRRRSRSLWDDACASTTIISTFTRTTNTEAAHKRHTADLAVECFLTVQTNAYYSTTTNTPHSQTDIVFALIAITVTGNPHVPPLCPRPPRSRSGCCLPPPLGCPESPSSSE